MAADKSHKFIRVRTFLDTCATANFVTERFAKRLNLPIYPWSLPVSAMIAMGTLSKHTIQITIKSLYNNYQKTFLTVSEIADLIPSEAFPRELMKIPHSIRLADPEFYLPQPIDMLIGLGASLSLFSIGQIDLSRDSHDLYLQKTRFGWVVAWILPGLKRAKQATCPIMDLNKQLETFWDIEEIGKDSFKSNVETEAEKHFVENISRRESGRYVVRLPFRKFEKQGKNHLDNSHDVALKRFYALERKLNSNSAL